MYLCVYARQYIGYQGIIMCTDAGRDQKNVRFPGAGVAGGCKLHSVDAEN